MQIARKIEINMTVSGRERRPGNKEYPIDSFVNFTKSSELHNNSKTVCIVFYSYDLLQLITHIDIQSHFDTKAHITLFFSMFFIPFLCFFSGFFGDAFYFNIIYTDVYDIMSLIYLVSH